LLTEAKLRKPRLRRIDHLSLRFGRETVERILRRELAGERDLRVLDVGCGGGAWRFVLEPYAGCWVGLDLERHPAVSTMGSAEALPFADESFDLIFSTSALEHIRGYREAIEEFGRVLRPGGRVLLGTHGSWEVHGAPHDYWRWTPHGLAESFRSFAECRVEQVGGPVMNYLALQNLYLRRLPGWAAWLLSPLVLLNNLVGICVGAQGGRAATLAIFYYVVARK
jgi:SAM-dependent methyltransferase